MTRNAPSLGQIGLIPVEASDTWVEKAIARITGSHVFHVVICTSETDLVEAEPGGVIRKPLSDWPEAIWSAYTMTPEQAQDSANYALNHLGTPYSFAGDAAIGFKMIFHAVPNWMFKLLSKDGHVECAQLGYDALVAAGLQPLPGKPVDAAVYPGSFEPVFKARDWW